MNIFDLFDKAKQSLKYPKITFPYEQQMIVFGLAGDKAKHPGTINITDDGRYPNNKFFGRIHRKQAERVLHIEWNERIAILPQLRETIKAIVSDPVSICKVVGQEFSFCCFCGLELTNKDSVTVGYGPICAEKWGLPHAGMFEKKNLENL